MRTEHLLIKIVSYTYLFLWSLLAIGNVIDEIRKGRSRRKDGDLIQVEPGRFVRYDKTTGRAEDLLK